MKTLNLLSIACILLLAGCGPEKNETATRGKLRVLAAESVLPPMTDEVREFLNLHAVDGAAITLESVSSDEAIRRLGRDSVRLIVTTRPITATERRLLPPIEHYELSEVLLAYDGLAVIVNEKNTVAKITTTELAGILSGDITRWEQLSRAEDAKGKFELVLQDSSDVTSFIDSRILHGKSVRKDVSYTNSSLAVLQSVASRPTAIGLIGITWVDSAHTSVKVLDIKETRAAADTSVHVATGSTVNFYSPHPANVYRSYYPLKRSIYAYWYAVPGSLASGFGGYISHADGQRLLLKRNVVPGTQPIRLKGSE
jgi:phosphate transport system substrate-binding protein